MPGPTGVAGPVGPTGIRGADSIIVGLPGEMGCTLRVVFGVCCGVWRVLWCLVCVVCVCVFT